MGGREGEAGAGGKPKARGLKQAFRLKEQCCAFTGRGVGGGGGGGGWEAKGKHSDSKSSAVPSLCGTN